MTLDSLKPFFQAYVLTAAFVLVIWVFEIYKGARVRGISARRSRQPSSD
jgi:hypothetical protein